MACGILAPWPGIELEPMAVKAWSPNHWTTREFPKVFLFKTLLLFVLLKSNLCTGLKKKKKPNSTKGYRVKSVSSTLHSVIAMYCLYPYQNRLCPHKQMRGFPGGSNGKESACNVGDLGSIPGLGRSPGEGSSYPLQYSGLENSMDRGAWQAI